MLNIRYYIVALIALLVFQSVDLKGQLQDPVSSSDILIRLKKLNTLGSVLYIAAHPDDENTRLLAYFAKGRNYRTSYLSCTRGDGGQNLIGTEQGPLLGLIRTNELLQARKYDGAEQFFTRAIDFGYSKSETETLEFWDRDKVLGDMVWVIRSTRPDVIFTRFPPQKFNYKTHGHHEASAILAEEAFQASGDPTRYPEQLKFVQPWKAKSLYWNGGTWALNQLGEGVEVPEMLTMDVGSFNPVLGMSYSEISAFSRTQHKSQGFGSSRQRGSVPEYFIHVAGEEALSDPFESVNTTWDRIDGAKPITSLIDLAIHTLDPEKPWKILPILLDIRKFLDKLEQGYWVIQKQQELEELIMACAGVYFEFIADAPTVTPGGEVEVTLLAIMRNEALVILEDAMLPYANKANRIDSTLGNNIQASFTFKLTIPSSENISQPYWLVDEPENIGTFSVQNILINGLPFSSNNLQSQIQFSILGENFTLKLPIWYKWTDRVEGELYKLLEITPPATVGLSENAIMFENGNSKEIVLKVRAWRDKVAGKLTLNMPDGWLSEPSSIDIDMAKAGDEINCIFRITPNGSDEGWLIPSIDIDGRYYSYSVHEFEYAHIPRQKLFSTARAKLVKLSVEKKALRIGYIMGAGDDLPHYLRATGYQVTSLDASNFDNEDLSQFDAIISGIRAYNTNTWLPAKHNALMEFVKQGGNYIVQYNTTWGLLSKELGPYPFTIDRGRVAEEDAPVKIIAPNHVLLNSPNKITELDFEGWIQERGVYFAKDWDSNFQPILSSHDKGEVPLDGSLIIADYGKGAFIYTGISFFRQIPAGVAGSYRLMANMISYGK